MPKENKFSGLYEPDKDTCTESSEENIQRFREATLKLDRIHNADVTIQNHPYSKMKSG